MTTLYRPVLIESAEQAEALPVGTIARHAEGAGMDHAHKVCPPLRGDVWVAVGGNCTNAEMIGWTALVPLEAEEEHAHRYARRAHGDMYTTPPRQELPGPARRLVTPWEERERS